MKRLLQALAVLPLLAATASAEPLQLTNAQMDQVSAGYFELDVSNTSVTMVSIFQRPYLTDTTANTLTCSNCYLLIVTPTFSVASHFGP